MLKSLYTSFHSDKAVAELDKLGVSIYKIGNDGQKEFRKAQDVMLDLAVSAQETDKSMESVYKTVSGGKWQYSKVAATLGDYSEFIRTWGEAVNSVGFTDKQVIMQMDTLSRRLQSLKVDMASIISNAGQGGLTQFFKEQVSSIDAFIMGLQRISPETLSAVASFAKLAITLAATNTLLRKFVTAETIATVANLATKIRETTSATEALALAMKALGRSGPMIALTLALTAGLYAVESYTNALGEEDQKEKESIATKQDQIALAGQQIETLQKQKEFSESMYGAYVKLDGIVNTSAEGSDKYNNALKNRETTEIELRKVMGDSAVDAIKNAGWTKEAYDKEAQSFTDSIETKKTAAGEYRKEMISALEVQKQVIEAQIDEYWQDAKNFNDSIASKINALTIWGVIQDEYYRTQADIASRQKSASEKALAETTKDVEDNPGNDILKRRQEMAQQELEGASYNLDFYNQKIINTEEGPLNKLKLQQAEIDKKIAETKLAGLPDFKGISSGGSQVDETPKKSKAGKIGRASCRERVCLYV